MNQKFKIAFENNVYIRQTEQPILEIGEGLGPYEKTSGGFSLFANGLIDQIDFKFCEARTTEVINAKQFLLSKLNEVLMDRKKLKISICIEEE